VRDDEDQVVGQHDGGLAFVLDPGPQGGDVGRVAGKRLRVERTGLAGQEPDPILHVRRVQILENAVKELPDTPVPVQSEICVHDRASDHYHDRGFGLGVEGIWMPSDRTAWMSPWRRTTETPGRTVGRVGLEPTT
jgi:hypothetical protein